jgi:predicted ATPase
MEDLRAMLSDIMRAYLEKADHFELYCIGQSCLLLHRIMTLLPTHLLTQEETESIHKRNSRLKRLIRFVDENYMHKVRLADFAEAEGTSPT